MSNLYCTVSVMQPGKPELEVRVVVDELCWKFSGDKKEMLRALLRKAADQVVEAIKE